MIVSEARRRRLRISLLAVALVFAAAGPARSQSSTGAKEKDGKRAAQEHLTRGNDLFTHDRYAPALEEFQAAFAAFPSPKLQFNLGQCERALGHDDAAIDHFQRFLDDAKDVSPALRAEAERYLAETRARVAEGAAREATSPALPIVVPVPSPATSAPLLPVAPPPPVAATVGEATAPTSVAPAPQRRSIASRWWFWTAVGVVAVGAVASIFLLTRPQDPTCPPADKSCFQ